MEKLYIILPVHNRVELSVKFAQCLARQNFQNFTLLLIDDGSTDSTAERVKAIITQTIVIRGEGNWWWAGSIQQGYNWLKKNAEHDSFVLIANDDLLFDEDYLRKGIEYLIRSPNAFVLSAAYDQKLTQNLLDCGVIYDFKNNRINSCDTQHLDQLNCLSTRGLFMQASDFLKTGGFRPRLLPHYYSDYEFSIRAHRKYGIALKCFLDLKVYMNNDTTGIEEISFHSLKEYWQKAFSKRYKTNPLYTMRYYLHAFPFPYNFRYYFKSLNFFLKTSFSLLIK